MTNFLLAVATFAVGWLIGFSGRRSRSSHVRERLQQQIEGLEELIALQRLKDHEDIEPVTEGVREWLAAATEQPIPPPTRPQRSKLDSVTGGA